VTKMKPRPPPRQNSEKQGASHPSDQKSLAGDPGRDRVNKGARERPGKAAVVHSLAFALLSDVLRLAG
jgi:hypothetical protein